VPRGCLRACCRHRGRGDPIALDDGHPEAVHDQLMRLVADPFGPTNELQGRKIAGWEERAYWLTKVSVDKSTLALVSRARPGIILECRGER
jgi:hypothetical protein